MLKTKSILAQKEDSDGLRISVMSRHTLEDGVTIDSRIKQNSYNIWDKELAPPAKLVGAYYRGELSFEDFYTKYQRHIRSDEMRSKVKFLAKEALTKDITLLCIEEKPEKCHRNILAKECQKYEPNLKVLIE